MDSESKRWVVSEIYFLSIGKFHNLTLLGKMQVFVTPKANIFSALGLTHGRKLRDYGLFNFYIGIYNFSEVFPCPFGRNFDNQSETDDI